MGVQYYPPQPQPQPPAQNNNRTIIIIVVVLLVLCCCCVLGSVALAWQYGDQVMEMLEDLSALPSLLPLA